MAGIYWPENMQVRFDIDVDADKLAEANYLAALRYQRVVNYRMRDTDGTTDRVIGFRVLSVATRFNSDGKREVVVDVEPSEAPHLLNVLGEYTPGDGERLLNG